VELLVQPTEVNQKQVWGSHGHGASSFSCATSSWSLSELCAPAFQTANADAVTKRPIFKHRCQSSLNPYQMTQKRQFLFANNFGLKCKKSRAVLFRCGVSCIEICFAQVQ
jgi:hypothetical protein